MSSGHGPDRLRQVGVAVRRAREARRLTIEVAAQRGPMSPVTWGNVEAGRPVKRLTYRGIEAGLGWPMGTIDDLFETDGAEPGTPPEPTVDDFVDGPELSEDEVKAAFAKIRESPSLGRRVKLDLMMQVLEMVGQTSEDRERQAG